MLNKKFNSKYAADENEGLSPDELASGGFSTFDPNALREYMKGIGIDPDAEDDDEDYPSGKTVFPFTVRKIEEGTASPEEFAAVQRTPRAQKGAERRRVINYLRAYSLALHQKARETHPCTKCGGKKFGGNIQQTTGNEREQKWCKRCANTGIDPSFGLPYDSDNPWNIYKSIKIHNQAVDFHHQNCIAERCHSQCQLKGAMDHYIRNWVDPETGEKRHPLDLEKSDTHLVTGWTKGRTAEQLANILRPKFLVDKYKPVAKAFTMLGGHEDSPIKKFDIVSFWNHDVLNPNSTIGYGEEQDFPRAERWSPEIVLRDEKGEPVIDRASGKPVTVYNPRLPQKNLRDQTAFNVTGGGVDKQMFAVVKNLSEDGKYADIIYHYRPIDRVRQERYDRIKGRIDRAIKYISGAHAVNSTADMSPQSKMFRDFAVTLLNRADKYIGERSPLMKGTYGYAENVPVETLTRESDVTLPGRCASGMVTQTIPRRRLVGWYQSRSNPRKMSNAFLDKKVKADFVYRVPHGFSEEEWKEGQKNAGDQTTREMMEQLSREAHGILGWSESHPNSLITPNVGNQRGVIPAATPSKITFGPATEKFNSGEQPSPRIETDLADSHEAVIPSVEVPGVFGGKKDSIDRLTSDQGSTFDILQKMVGRQMSQSEQQQALEDIKKTGSIRETAEKFKTPEETTPFNMESEDDYGF